MTTEKIIKPRIYGTSKLGLGDFIWWGILLGFIYLFYSITIYFIK
jgi:hypothetical protein